MELMTRQKRKEEVRRILALDTDELIKQSNGQLKVFDTLDEVYEFLAEEMVNEFEKAAKGDKIVSFIMPVGPTQPYRIMAEKINYRNLSLKNVRFFFMDEYVDDEKDELIPMSNSIIEYQNDLNRLRERQDYLREVLDMAIAIKRCSLVQLLRDTVLYIVHCDDEVEYVYRRKQDQNRTGIVQMQVRHPQERWYHTPGGSPLSIWARGRRWQTFQELFAD